jgi:hypothetical protein
MINKLYSWFAGVAAMIGILFFIFQKGKSEEKQKQATKELKDYKDTRTRIDEVDINTERDAALDRLRKSGKVR